MGTYGWPRELLHRFGIDLVRFRGARFPELLPLELARKHDASVFLDVGAGIGQTGRFLRELGYSGRIISFEPQAESFRRLAMAAADDPTWSCVKLALGAANEAVSVNVAANASSSSLLPMTEQHRQAAPEATYTTTETVDVRRLDDVAPDFLQKDDRVYLKLDVQGYEAHVIAGASATLARTVVVQAEVSLKELYAGQPLMFDFVTLIRDKGFVPLHVTPEFHDRRTGELLQLNAWFGRTAE